MSKFVTYEQMVELLDSRLASLQEQAKKPARPHAVTGLLSAVVATSSAKLDGQVTLADVFVSCSIAVGSSTIGFVAAAGSILTGWGAPTEVWGCFTLAGCGLGITRLGIDALAIPILWSDLVRQVIDYRERRQAPVLDEQETDIEHGLRIVCKDGNKITFLLLLPDVKRPLVKQMVRDAARLYWGAGGRKTEDERAFSQRKTGKPFGDRLGEVKAILEKAGHITPAKNNTHQFTLRGKNWLIDHL